MKPGKLVYGGWQLGGGPSWVPAPKERAVASVREALDLGVRVFDTAPTYGNGRSEELLGEALGADRGSAEIVTKFGIRFDDLGTTWADFSETSVRRECEASLRRLRTDRIDLYLLHAPDRGLEPERLAATLEALKKEGKILAWGVSNATRTLLAQFVRLGASWCQDYHNVLEPEEAPSAVMPFLSGARFMAYSPLARGMLAAGSVSAAAAPSSDGALWRFARAADPRRSAALDARLAALKAAAKIRGVSLPRLALDWLAADARTRAVAVGARKPEHLREAVESLGALRSVLAD